MLTNPNIYTKMNHTRNHDDPNRSSEDDDQDQDHLADEQNGLTVGQDRGLEEAGRLLLEEATILREDSERYHQRAGELKSHARASTAMSPSSDADGSTHAREQLLALLGPQIRRLQEEGSNLRAAAEHVDQQLVALRHQAEIAASQDGRASIQARTVTRGTQADDGDERTSSVLDILRERPDFLNGILELHVSVSQQAESQARPPSEHHMIVQAEDQDTYKQLVNGDPALLNLVEFLRRQPNFFDFLDSSGVIRLPTAVGAGADRHPVLHVGGAIEGRARLLDENAGSSENRFDGLLEMTHHPVPTFDNLGRGVMLTRLMEANALPVLGVGGPRYEHPGTHARPRTERVATGLEAQYDSISRRRILRTTALFDNRLLEDDSDDSEDEAVLRERIGPELSYEGRLALGDEGLRLPRYNGEMELYVGEEYAEAFERALSRGA